MKNIKIGLLPRIFIAIILGILLGGIMPHWLLRVFATVSDLFSEFLGFIVPLLILSLVTVAIVEVGHGAGKMLLATVLIAFASTVIAGVLSYSVGCISFPGMITSETDLDTSAAASAVKPFFQLDIAPLMGVTSALTFAFIMGLGIVAVDNSTLRNFFAGMRDIIMLVISKVIIPLLPIYIFCIFIDITQAGQVTRVLSVFFKIIIVIFILHIFWLLFQYCVAGVIVKRNPIKLLYTMLPAYMTALGTQSSAATIPVTLKQTIDNGVSRGVADFVVPLCATIHLSGSMLKIVACALALMMMQGIPIETSTIIHFIFMLTITVIAAPGVPGGVIMASLGVLSSILGFGETDLALMIALYIAMDSFGTACNVTGDGAIALVIDRYFGEKKE